MKCSGNQLRCFFDNPEFVFLSDLSTKPVLFEFWSLDNLQMQFLNKFLLFYLMLRIFTDTKPACTQPSLPGHERPFRKQGSTESRLSSYKLQRDSIPAESSFSPKWSDPKTQAGLILCIGILN